MKLDLIKEKSAQNLLKSISDSKNRPLKRFLTSLSIKLVGKETAELIANDFLTLDKVQNATKEALVEIDGVGDKVAESVVEFFKDDDNKKLLEKLHDFGVIPQSADSEKVSDKFKNLTFVITGTLSKPRSDYEAIIKSMGGKVSSSVSKKTSYVLCGENPGSKFDKATSLGVIIIDENSFKDMVNE